MTSVLCYAPFAYNNKKCWKLSEPPLSIRVVSNGYSQHWFLVEYSFKLHHYICLDSVNTFSTIRNIIAKSFSCAHFQVQRWSKSPVTCDCIHYYILQQCFSSLTLFALRPVLTLHHGRVSNCLSSASQQHAISCVWVYMYVFPSLQKQPPLQLHCILPS